jgi:putative endonuclease
MSGWVYIVTNKPNGARYVGVTSDIAKRAWEHREGVVEGFTKRYGLKRLVYVERHEDIRLALQREKNIKHWARAWKIDLVVQANPNWDDLYDSLRIHHRPATTTGRICLTYSRRNYGETTTSSRPPRRAASAPYSPAISGAPRAPPPTNRPGQPR